MARKSPAPLALSNLTSAPVPSFEATSPSSVSSPKSPKSPKPLFRRSTKLGSPSTSEMPVPPRSIGGYNGSSDSKSKATIEPAIANHTVIADGQTANTPVSDSVRRTNTGNSADENEPTSRGSFRKPRPNFFGTLSRGGSKPNSSSDLTTIADAAPETGPRTAPPGETDRSFRDLMASNIRQRSEDRQAAKARDIPQPEASGKIQPSFSTSLRENGSSFLKTVTRTSTRAAGKFGTGFFGKASRSSSFGAKESRVSDEEYVFRVINTPLVEQVRATRLSKRLEYAKDKTEFWLPAIAWRCLEYLYTKVEQEGLYRTPGSNLEVRRWMRRFDEDGDVNLLEAEDLHDWNIIAFLFKRWIRDLPDEIFPKASQDKVAKVCAGDDTQSVPQVLKDEIAKLPPQNYFLLYAITCQLMKMLEHSERNKMDLHNITICFQPCIGIDTVCFRYMVRDWHRVFAGNPPVSEDEWTAVEYALFDEDTSPTSSAGGMSSRSEGYVESHDERAISSSDSSHHRAEMPKTGAKKNGNNNNNNNNNNSNSNVNAETKKPASTGQMPEITRTTGGGGSGGGVGTGAGAGAGGSGGSGMINPWRANAAARKAGPPSAWHQIDGGTGGEDGTGTGTGMGKADAASTSAAAAAAAPAAASAGEKESRGRNASDTSSSQLPPLMPLSPMGLKMD